MKKLNHMAVGMHPLNHASALVKTSSDVMFSLAVNDESSTLARLDALEQTIAKLRTAIDETPEVPQ
jgi:hypothetical protein